MMELGSGDYGFSHYRRRCKIRSPCCSEIFYCRHCHNEAKNALVTNLLDQHDIPRYEVTKVIAIQNKMFNRIASNVEFVWESTSAQSANSLMMRFPRTNITVMNVEYAELVELKDNFFHCTRCGCCYSNSIKDAHHCAEGAMHHNCPVCFEFLFETMKDITRTYNAFGMREEMEQHCRYSCPVCSKSICDMSNFWRKLDQEIVATPMPDIYQNKRLSSSIPHSGLRCPSCNSCNTRQTQGGPATSCTSEIAGMMR